MRPAGQAPARLRAQDARPGRPDAAGMRCRARPRVYVSGMRKPGKPTHREPDREPRSQFAALPWRRGPDGGVEVLLITSRETHRWVIPKGWPIKGKSAWKSAAREAFEEAGIQGKI